ncbi:MAG: (2Fe-2S)-binding protein [Thermoanaerobaculaceae bacterium]|nr:(2Fe-2S)-binding protein [Thermoanaerobaculaceae bacterium]
MSLGKEMGTQAGEKGGRMLSLSVDGKSVQVREGAFVLEAARAAGVEIPTLCHHPALEPYGGCRLCLVDVTRPEWGGWCKLVIACQFPAEEGLLVHTATERVVETRRVVLDLLLARCPETPLVQELARRHGIEQTSYVANPEPTDCILCALCTRVCDHLGISAIATVNRGIGREVAPPWGEAPPDCIGCLACAEICPTSCIPYETSEGSRTIWGKTFEMLRCTRCGRAHVTVAEADFFAGRGGVPRSYFELCDACKRKEMAATFVKLSRGAAGFSVGA